MGLVNACFWHPFGNQNRSLVTVSPSNAFLSIFGSLLAPLWHPFGPFGCPFGSILCVFGSTFYSFGSFGPLWLHFGCLFLSFCFLIKCYLLFCLPLGPLAELLPQATERRAVYRNVRLGSSCRVRGSKFGSAESRSVNNSRFI